MTPNTVDKRLFGLDLMRSIAILMVLISHSSLLFKETRLAGFPWIGIIDGVEIFFVLSGFLIGSMLINLFRSASTNIRTLISFWIRRWFRTLPSYYFILLVNIVLASFNLTGSQVQAFNYKFLFFTQNFHWFFYGFFMESWSLCVEEWFYIFFPSLIVAGSFFFSFKKAFWAAIIIIISGAIFFRILREHPVQSQFQWDFQIRKLVITRLDTILWGCIAAWVSIYQNSFWKKYRYIFAALGAILLYLSSEPAGFPNTFYYKVLFFSVQSIAIVLWLPFLYYLPRPNEWIGRFVLWISTISYSLYLIHGIFIGIILYKFPVVNSANAVVKFVVFWLLSLTAGHFFYKYYEAPMMKLRDRGFIKKVVGA